MSEVNPAECFFNPWFLVSSFLICLIALLCSIKVFEKYDIRQAALQRKVSSFRIKRGFYGF